MMKSRVLVKGFGVVTVLFAICFLSAQAQPLEKDIEIVSTLIVEATPHDSTMTGDSYQEQFRERMRKLKTSKAWRDQRARDDQELIAIRREMNEKGYAVQSDQFVNLPLFYVSKLEESKKPEQIRAQLAFEPLAMRAGMEIVGVFGDAEDDGRIHEVVELVSHPTFGVVVITERSLTTLPSEVPLYIRGPKFDMDINGAPALLSTFQTLDGKHGRTGVSILHPDILVHLNVMSTILRDDPRFSELMDLAYQL